MAVLGYTKLEAVNIIAQSIGEGRFSDLTSTTAADIEYYLDIWDREIQSWGWPENSDFARSYTPTGSPLKIQVASDTLWVRGHDAYDQHRYTLRGDYVYDTRTQSDEFASATAIRLDTIKKLSFENLAPTTKQFIVKYAMMNYQIHRKGDPILTAFHAQQAALFDQMAARVLPMNRPQLNMTPVMKAAMTAANA